MSEEDKSSLVFQGLGADNVLRLLDSMKATPEGNVVYRHVAVVVREMERAQNKISRGYAAVLHNLLNAIRKQLPPDSLLNVELKLVQKRLQPPISLTELSALQGYLEKATRLASEVSEFDHDAIRKTFEPLIQQIPQNETGQIRDLNKISAEIPTPMDSQATISIDALKMAEMSQSHDDIRKEKADDETAEKKHALLNEQIFNVIQQQTRSGLLLEEILQKITHTAEQKDFEQIRDHAVGEIQHMLAEQNHLVKVLNETQTLIARKNRELLNEELRHVRVLSLTDELTELPNRRAFLQRLDDEIERARRYDTVFSIALIDLDNFKTINDSHGHQAGDEMLKLYAKDVLSMFRRLDMVARYGGEEFAVLFPSTDQDEALQALEKVKKRATNTVLHFNQLMIKAPSFSAGLVVCKKNETAQNVINRADKALYQAKKNGRDRIEIDKTDKDIPAFTNKV